jgi:hypothetical protein
MGKKKKQPKLALVCQFWLLGRNHKELEKLDNKITDLLFKKYGQQIGVMTGQYVDPDVLEMNAAERALERLDRPVPKPWGKNQAHTHAYNAATRHAVNVLREELTKYHGM